MLSINLKIINILVTSFILVITAHQNHILSINNIDQLLSTSLGKYKTNNQIYNDYNNNNNDFISNFYDFKKNQTISLDTNLLSSRSARCK